MKINENDSANGTSTSSQVGGVITPTVTPASSKRPIYLAFCAGIIVGAIATAAIGTHAEQCYPTPTMKVCVKH